ncbi:MAG: TIR domain-containing protein, partial [Gemmatimonadetes bacterium]|nr:TIR domain-containing protein [Gemmatimonadota bacterium]
AMVVLLTPDALKSIWVQRDVEYALGALEYSGRLIPVLIDPDKTIAEDDIPWILKRLNIIDLTEYETEEDGIRRIADTLLTAS